MCFPKRNKKGKNKKNDKEICPSAHPSNHDKKVNTTRADAKRSGQWDVDSNRAVKDPYKTKNNKEDTPGRIREDHGDRIYETPKRMDTQNYPNNKGWGDYRNTKNDGYHADQRYRKPETPERNATYNYKGWGDYRNTKNDGYHADQRYRKPETPERNATNNYKTRNDYTNTGWKNIAGSNGNIDSLLSQVTEENVVGIFSSSAESNYKWLKGLLEPRVKRVDSNYISNNSKLKFMENIQQCNLGILYHTSTSGRINITDVTDSMYDEELKYMSDMLGKKNVLVVVDDLNDDTDQEKENLLQSQPSIAHYAKDLILISKTEKAKNSRFRT